VPISLPLKDDDSRDSGESALVIAYSIDVDFNELVREGAEPFVKRARALLEEKLAPLLAIPWEGVRATLDRNIAGISTAQPERVAEGESPDS
jgi:hypothetical protein